MRRASKVRRMNQQEKTHNRIRMALGNDRALREKIRHDFSSAFQRLGLAQSDADTLTNEIFITLQGSSDLKLAESAIRRKIEQTTVTPQNAEKAQSLTQAFNILSTAHRKNLYNDITGNETEREILDIQTNGGAYIPDRKFGTTVANNILHHALNAEERITKLLNATAGKLIVIETCPDNGTTHDQKNEHERTFMSDYLGSRLLSALPPEEIPPFTDYKTPREWSEQIEQQGWKLKTSRNLGPHPVIANTSHLLVFEKE